MKLIPLTQGKFVKVDDADFEWLNQWKWHYKKSAYGNGYAVRKVYIGKGGNSSRGYYYRSIQMHRLIIGAPEGMDVDHRDGNGLNNCLANLRVCTHMQNLQNRPVKSSAKSGFKGVTWDNRSKKWWAKITANNQNIHLGYYLDKNEAARVYNEAAKIHHGEFARLNIV